MEKLAIIQARMGSTRLPGKVLKQVKGRSLLSYLLERVKKAKKIDKIVVATTTNPIDEAICEEAKKEGVECFQGSEQNVLERYYSCAKKYKPKTVIRITGDCPLIDPEVIDEAIEVYSKHEGEIDYLSNCAFRTYPRGMDTEVFSFKVLEEAYQEHKGLFEEEHVTPYIYRHPEKFHLGQVLNKKDCHHLRLTVDTPEDFELIRILIEKLYPQMSLNDIVDYLEKNPELLKINAHVQQKA